MHKHRLGLESFTHLDFQFHLISTDYRVLCAARILLASISTDTWQVLLGWTTTCSKVIDGM